jgi:hypothetical protein
MAINDLNVGAWASSSQIPFADVQNGQDRRASVADLTTYLQGQLTAAGGFESLYLAPNATGWSVTANPVTPGGNAYLIVAQAAGYAAGTVTMPATPEHEQEVLVSIVNSVTTLTVSGNGKTVYGAPTSVTTYGFFRMRYDGVNQAWYRVG